MCSASDAGRGVVAQEPTQDPPNAGEQEPSSAPARGGRRGQGRDGQGRRGRRAGFVVIEAGTVHPVAGPPIENGVVVIRGERILAVGQQGELQLPPGTTVHRFPEGHVYPGLIDAQTDAFTDRGVQQDGSLDAGSEIADALVWSGGRDDQLVRHGVTTAYVTVRSGAQSRGQGAIVRPRKAGFELWEDREHAAVQLLMAQGTGSSHPLQRQQRLEAIGRLFDGLDEYREAQEKFEKDLEKYDEDFEKYLAHHRKKNGKEDKPADGEKGADAEGGASEAPAEGAQPGRGGRRGGRRGGGRPPQPGGGEEGGGNGGVMPDETVDVTPETFATLQRVMALVGAAEPVAPQDPRPRGRRGARPQGQQPQAPAQDGEKKPDDAAKKDDGPARPTYPKKPRPDPQKDALLRVVDGDLPLRVEAHRVDELRAALRLQREEEVPLLVLEQAYEADRLAGEIAENGATVVLTEVLPNSLAAPGDDRNPYARFDPTALPAKLNRAGVPFAIASGDARLAQVLPMIAASAIGRGLSPEAALRALTLTPAEILGIAEDTGSLSRGKFADVLVTDAPLFQSDSRVLLVLSKGRTEFEAK